MFWMSLGTDICIFTLWLLVPNWSWGKPRASPEAKNTFCPLIWAQRWPLHSDVCLLAATPASGLQTGRLQYTLPGATPETIWAFSCCTIQEPACSKAEDPDGAGDTCSEAVWLSAAGNSVWKMADYKHCEIIPQHMLMLFHGKKGRKKKKKRAFLGKINLKSTMDEQWS